MLVLKLTDAGAESAPPFIQVVGLESRSMDHFPTSPSVSCSDGIVDGIHCCFEKQSLIVTERGLYERAVCHIGSDEVEFCR